MGKGQRKYVVKIIGSGDGITLDDKLISISNLIFEMLVKAQSQLQSQSEDYKDHQGCKQSQQSAV